MFDDLNVAKFSTTDVVSEFDDAKTLYITSTKNILPSDEAGWKVYCNMAYRANRHNRKHELYYMT